MSKFFADAAANIAIRALLIRAPNNLETGAARLYIPGTKFVPFAQANKLILGTCPATTEIYSYNAYSRSTSDSHEWQQFLQANPAQRIDILSYLLTQRFTLSETEAHLTEPCGLISAASHDHEDVFQEAESRGLPAFVLKDSHLFQKTSDNKLVPATFPSNIISLDKRVKSTSELQEQEGYLRQTYETFIDNNAKRLTLSQYLQFLENQRKYTIDPMNLQIFLNTLAKALLTNPGFAKAYEEHKKQTTTREVESPSVTPQKKEGEKFEAGSLSYNPENFNSLGGD